MMFHMSYLVYSENYTVCLLITTRTNQSGKYNTMHVNLGFPITTLVIGLHARSRVIIHRESQATMHYL